MVNLGLFHHALLWPPRSMMKLGSASINTACTCHTCLHSVIKLPALPGDKAPGKIQLHAGNRLQILRSSQMVVSYVTHRIYRRALDNKAYTHLPTMSHGAHRHWLPFHSICLHLRLRHADRGLRVDRPTHWSAPFHSGRTIV